MLEKISAIKYERCYPSRLKSFFQSKINYKTYSDIVPYAKRAVVGNIPSEIISLFSKSEREYKIKAFQSALSQTVQACREKKDVSEINEVFRNGIKDIMPDGTQTEMEYIGQGGYKKVYRMSISDKAGKKVMHDKALLVYDMNYAVFARQSHGVYAEPNSWYYLQKNIGHKMDTTQFTRHYISDMKSGYSITEFIDSDIRNTTHEFQHNRMYGLILTDSANNKRINKKVYDIGGMLKITDSLQDRLELKYFKKIANRNTQKEREQVATQLTEKTKNPKTPHRDKIIRAVEFYRELPESYWKRNSETIPIKLIW